jgi:hypothetical protein
MHLAHYLEMLRQAAQRLHDAYLSAAEGHPDEPDLARLCRRLANECSDQAEAAGPFADRYAANAPAEPDNLHSDLFRGPRAGGLGLLRDLHDLYLMATECDLAWTAIGQAAYGARDEQLIALVGRCSEQTKTQLRWLRTRLRQTAPQALVVAT